MNMLNIEKIFSTKERIKILNQVIFWERPFGVSEIAKELNLSKGLISKYFDILAKEGILKRIKGKFSVETNPKVKGIKILLNIQKIDFSFFKKYKFIKAIGLYGSCAKGTNTESSDIDLWIKIEKAKDEDIAKLSSELRNKIKNIKILVLDNEKLKLLKKKDALFYHSLHFGSIILYGNENEI